MFIAKFIYYSYRTVVKILLQNKTLNEMVPNVFRCQMDDSFVYFSLNLKFEVVEIRKEYII